MQSKLFWETANGVKIDLNKIDHQHLSNIIWFNRVFHNWESGKKWNIIRTAIQNELQTRFDNVLLPWEPLPVPNEIELIKHYCTIDNDDNIVWKGNVIGSISHLIKLNNVLRD